MFRKLTIRFAALVLVSVVCLLLTEVTLRVFDPFQFRIRSGKIVLPKGGSAKLTDGRVHTKNELGFQGPSKPTPFSDYLSIVAVGGSTTEDLLLADGEGWVAQLSNRLSPKFDKVWVNNAGMTGHSTFAHLVLVRDFLSSLRPKVALFLVGVNDLGIAKARNYDLNNIEAEEVGDYLRFFARKSEIAHVWSNLKRHWQAKRLGMVPPVMSHAPGPYAIESLPHFRTRKEEWEKERLALLKPLLPGYRARVEELVRLCRGHGITPVLLTQPLLFGYTRDPRTGVSLGDLDWITGGYSSGSEWDAVELYNEVTRDVAKALGVMTIDLAAKMPKDSTYFYDYMHYNAAGAAKVGELVAEALCPYLKENFPAHSAAPCRLDVSVQRGQNDKKPL